MHIRHRLRGISSRKISARCSDRFEPQRSKNSAGLGREQRTTSAKFLVKSAARSIPQTNARFVMKCHKICEKKHANSSQFFCEFRIQRAEDSRADSQNAQRRSHDVGAALHRVGAAFLGRKRRVCGVDFAKVLRIKIRRNFV